MFVTTKSEPSLILKSQYPPASSTQVASESEVALSICHAVGAVAAAVLTEVVAFLREFADPVVFWLSVGKVQLARLPLAGVPSAGVTSAGLVKVPVVTVGFVSVLFVSVCVPRRLTMAQSTSSGS